MNSVKLLIASFIIVSSISYAMNENSQLLQSMSKEELEIELSQLTKDSAFLQFEIYFTRSIHECNLQKLKKKDPEGTNPGAYEAQSYFAHQALLPLLHKQQQQQKKKKILQSLIEKKSKK